MHLTQFQGALATLVSDTMSHSSLYSSGQIESYHRGFSLLGIELPLNQDRSAKDVSNVIAAILKNTHKTLDSRHVGLIVMILWCPSTYSV